MLSFNIYEQCFYLLNNEENFGLKAERKQVGGLL
jgi:hypothetical protein